jgi:hypothetical protein
LYQRNSFGVTVGEELPSKEEIIAISPFRHLSKEWNCKVGDLQLRFVA